MKDRNIVYSDLGIHFESYPKKQIMMYWEEPLMHEHAQHLTKSLSDSHKILELGFGLGISAQHIYDLHKDLDDYHHTIYEIHPVIAKEARKWASNKTNVTIIEKDWAEDLEYITSCKYDGIFLDTHDDSNFVNFRKLVLDHSLKKGGVFTYMTTNDKDHFFFGNDLKYTYVNVDPKDCFYFKESQIPCPYYIKDC